MVCVVHLVVKYDSLLLVEEGSPQCALFAELLLAAHIVKLN